MRTLSGTSQIALMLGAGLLSVALVGAVLAEDGKGASNPTQANGKPVTAAAKTDKNGNVGLKKKVAPAGKTKVMPLADDGSGPDLSALRYYISQDQKDRVEIEIKRLKKLYPQWEVPPGIYDTRAAGAVDEQPLWDLFASGEMDKLREEIARRQKEEPGWKPSDDLADKIKRKDMRIKITDLWKAGKWKDLVNFVKAEGYGGDEADIDIMWTVAEAYAKTKQIGSAFGIYESVLKSNNNPQHRLATLQKAMGTLRMTEVEKLIAMARTDASGKSEFEPIAKDITRARISAFLHDERKEEVAEDEMTSFKEYARTATDANQSGLVAWYSYKRKVLPEALEWFKIAVSRGGDSMVAHGLAHTLRELKLQRDTEEVAYAWREPLVNNSILFIDNLERDLTREIPPYIEPLRLRRYAQVTMDSAAGQGAQALGWYAYNTCQFKVALEWFQHAVAWHPKEATVYGLAITLRRLKMNNEFWDLINRYDGLFPKVIEIIYPDDYEHPPTPCDIFRKKGHKAASNYIQTRVNQFQQGYSASQNLTQAQSFSAVPPPDPAAAPVWQTQSGYAAPRKLRKNIREPKISRTLFPVSVDGQNSMRRWPVGRMMGRPAEAASKRRGAQAGLPVEPVRPMRQLVARRVPGVGPMPYERWGYQLLPGYAGQRDASAPHTAVTAPKGTLWTTLHVGDAQATQGDKFDPSTPEGARNLALALEAIARAPNVPAPGESKSGPWTSPNPYKSQEQLDAEKAPGEMVAQQPAPAAPPSIIRGNLTDAAIEKAARSGDAPAAAAIAPAAPVVPVKPQAPKPVSAVSVKPARERIAAQAPMVVEPVIAESAAAAPASGLRIETGARDEMGRLATDLYNQKKYSQALQMLNKRSARYPETTKLTLLRAWALLNLRRVDEAKQVFASIGRGATGAPVEPASMRTGGQ